MARAFDIILISPEQDLDGELQSLIQLFNLGLKIYHLRKSDWGVEEGQRFLLNIPKEFHNRVVLHSHFELAHEFAVKGIHLNESNKKRVAEFGKYQIISASFHSLEDLKDIGYSYPYVFLSPVFDSISKVGYKANFDLSRLAEQLQGIRQQNKSVTKVIALGGINAQNISLLKPAGFSGAALLGAVWQNENPAKAFIQINSALASGG